jgi:hypothetical protein
MLLKLCLLLGVAAAINPELTFEDQNGDQCTLAKNGNKLELTGCTAGSGLSDPSVVQKLSDEQKKLSDQIESLKECQYGAWTAWDTCTNECDGVHEYRVGSQTRTRIVARHAIPPKEDCKVSQLWDDRQCNEAPCPVHCKIGDWGAWSQCTASCDGGSQTRTRTNIDPKNGGNTCPPDETDVEIKECGTQSCAATYIGHPSITSSGVYDFNIQGDQFKAYVYVGDGGRWAKVWQSPGSHVARGSHGINEYSSCFLGSGVGCNAKLRDDRINKLCLQSGPHAGGWTTWRVSGSDTGKKAYFRSTRNFNNANHSPVFNLYQSGHTQVQESHCVNCRGFRTSHWRTIDSLHWHRGGGDVGNNHERYFMDYSGAWNPGCYGTGSRSHRCFSSAIHGHHSIPNQALWCRTY